MQQFIRIQNSFWKTVAGDSCVRISNALKPTSGVRTCVCCVLVPGIISDTRIQKVLLIFCAEGVHSSPCWNLHLGALCNLHWVPHSAATES